MEHELVVQKAPDGYSQKLVTGPYRLSISRPSKDSMKLELRTGLHICPIKHRGVGSCNGASRPGGGLFCGSWAGTVAEQVVGRPRRGYLGRQEGAAPVWDRL